MKDVSDFLDAGGTANQLTELIDSAPHGYSPRTSEQQRAARPGAGSRRLASRLGLRSNAELVAGENRDVIRFNVNRGEWMLWTGSHWKYDDTGYVINCVKAESATAREGD